MCDCVLPSTRPTHPCIKTRHPGLPTFNWRPKITNAGLQCNFGSNTKKSSNSTKVIPNSTASKPEDHLGFKEIQDEATDLGLDSTEFSSIDFLELDEKSGEKSEGRLKDEDLVKIEMSDDVELRSGKQLLRRSNMIAKQVISVYSARTLGFVSQLWVDTNAWVVLIVEVRPNLLSGESERLFLEDISQVGDVVLIQDESIMENEFKMVGLETLVGYNVVTPSRRNIGKVRGYNFNINSGVIESLELDSFGISIIPSSLVSTYALFVEDVLEVVSDTVVVHEAAASRMQRLTKGFWDAQKVGNSMDELGEYPDLETQPIRSAYARGRRRSGRRNSRPKMRDMEDEWELPMDYL